LTKLKRVPELQKCIGGKAIAEFAYELSFNDNFNTSKLYDTFKLLPVADRLHFIEVIESIVLTLRSYPTFDPDYTLINKLQQILSNIDVNSSTQFERFAALAALERIRTIYYEFSESTNIVNSERPRRPYFRIPAASNEAFEHITFDREVSSNDSIVPIAVGYVGVKDQHGRLQYIGKVSSNTEQHTEVAQQVTLLPASLVLSDITIRPIISDNPRDIEGFLFEEMHKPFIQDHINKDLGITLSELGLREQVQLLEFLSQARKSEYDDICKAFVMMGAERILLAQALFSSHVSKDMGRKLISYILRSTFDESKILCALYTKASKNIDSIRDELSRYLPSVDLESMLRNIIITYSERLNGALKNYIESDSKNETDDLFSSFAVDLALFSAIIREASKDTTQPLQLEDFDHLEVVSNTEQFSNADIDRIKDIIIKGYKGKDPIFVYETVLRGAVEAAISDPTSFRVLRKHGTIIAFFRLKEYQDEFYAGSFNVDTRAAGSGIGNLFLKKIIREASEQKPVHAGVDMANPVASYYINTLGFFATHIDTQVGNSTINALHICLDNTNNRSYEDSTNKEYESLSACVDDARQFFKKGFVITKYTVTSQGVALEYAKLTQEEISAA
jgi:L-amino acid N-acyltransferase YncA